MTMHEAYEAVKRLSDNSTGSVQLTYATFLNDQAPNCCATVFHSMFSGGCANFTGSNWADVIEDASRRIAGLPVRSGLGEDDSTANRESK